MGHIQVKFESHNLNFLIPLEYFTTPSAPPPPELSLPLLKFLNPPKISKPPPKKILTPPEKMSPISKKIATPPEKSQPPPPEISQPPIYLMVLVNGTFTKQSYELFIAHCFSYIAPQSILNYE